MFEPWLWKKGTLKKKMYFNLLTKKYFSKHIGNISDAPLFVHTFKDADHWLNEFLENRFEKFAKRYLSPTNKR